MTTRSKTTTHTLGSLGLAALVVSALASRPAAAAEPTERAPAATRAKSYRHAPVTLWLAPHVGTGGMATGTLKTNLAVSLGASAYARLEGVDVGVGASWVTEAMRGVQTTAGFNFVGADVRGAQISVGANVALDRVSGAQVSSGVNVGPAIGGAQIGLVNIGGQVSGAQVGLVNIGRRVKGTQIGLVNVAEDSSAPLGLFNLIKNGQQHLALWASDSAPLNLGLKLGGRYVYAVLAAGLETSDGKKRWLAGFGMGGHIPLSERFYLETDLLHWHVNEDEAWTDGQNALTTLRLVGGYRLHRRFSLFAGPTLNLLVTSVGGGEGFGLIRGARLTADGSATTVRLWPGFSAGFQI
ncbi:MAG: hypothetical protein IT371_14435 [Deltaproteobacteria bacterium]|nr:hypothetical protein [Deltaproteobacteria bacterium]